MTLVLDVDEEKFISRYLETAPETGGRVIEHLLDGQQRLTALWRALHNNYKNTKYFIYFSKYDNDYDKTNDKEIRVWSGTRWENKNGKKMPLWADVPEDTFIRGLIPMELFRPGDISAEYEAWVSEATSPLKPSSDSENFEQKLTEWMEFQREVLNTIRDYRETITHFNLPFLVLPSGTDKATALQVFINMNTNSKPLSQYDIIRAEIEGVKGVSLDDYQDKLNSTHSNIQHYFELPFLILATSALIQDKLPNQRGMWDMQKDIMIDNWGKMTNGLSKMAIFLESQGVYDKERLPTNAVLAVIASLYTHIPENLDARGNHEILLKKYLWSSFFTDRYENSAATHAYNDFTALKKIILGEKKDNGEFWQESDVPVLNRELTPISTEDELKRVNWPKRVNIRARAIMAVFSKLGAYDFADGSQLTRQQLNDGKRHYHHVFPDSLLKEAEVESFLALNCSLITDKTNYDISNKDPMQYLKERYNWTSEDIVNTRLESHLIPIQELKHGGYQDIPQDEKIEKIKTDFSNFISKRAAYVVKAIESLTDGRDIVASEIITAVHDIEEAN